jgi:cysteine synthase
MAMKMIDDARRFAASGTIIEGTSSNEGPVLAAIIRGYK